MANAPSLLSQVAIILSHPKIPENIGAAARIIWNMGVDRLILVRDSVPERDSMAKMATHKAAHLIDEMKIYPTLQEALEEFTLVVGTTARRGRQRFVNQTPREMVETLLPQLSNNKVAIIFGPEDTGLTNDDLRLCQLTAAIPTADFSSLNLAQAVAIFCYELHYGIIHASKDMTPAPQLATSYELESMYSYLEQSLYSINFMEKVSHSYWMSNIRNFFSRMLLTSKDANIIRGICKKYLLQQNNRKS